MRLLILAALPLSILAGCAGTAETKPAGAGKAPQCYSGDHGKFFDVGAKAELSGVAVVCEKTSDGKNAQWMGVKK